MNEIQRLTGKGIIKSLKSKYQDKRSATEKISDLLTEYFGGFAFLVINVAFFTFWILAHTGNIPFVEPFDPFPFSFLTLIVSLEAIILSIFVLISQNRAARVDDLRQEVDLEVDLITERELTKIMEIIKKIAEKNGIDLSKDKELQTMLKPLEENKIEKTLEKQV